MARLAEEMVSQPFAATAWPGALTSPQPDPVVHNRSVASPFRLSARWTADVHRPVPTTVFTHHEALAAGWTQSALTHAVSRGRLRRLRRGVYVVGTTPEPGAVLDAIGAARAYPRAVISHRSALLMHGLPLIGGMPPRPEMTVPPRAGANLHRVHVHRATVREEDLAIVRGIRLTSVARTVVDVARHRPVTAGVAAVDAALHAAEISGEDVADVLHACRTWPRIARARRAIALSDGRAESPLESVSRLTMAWLGIAQPHLQAVILDRYGRLIGRADFYWDDVGVVGEADGALKYNEPTALIREKQRQEALEELGLIVVRWGWDDVVHRRQALAGRLHSAFERGRRRDRSGFPRLWTL